MKTHPLRNLLVFVVAVAAILGAVLIWGNRPSLGLDLQGGVSVSLEAVDDSGNTVSNPDAEALEQSRGIIERRVNALGLSEPEVTTQGPTIVVQLPGVSNAEQVLAAVGKTAELRFRPVLQRLGQVDRIPKDQIPAKEQELAAKRQALGIPADKTAQQVFEAEQQAQQQNATAAPPTGATGDTGASGNTGATGNTGETGASASTTTTSFVPLNEWKIDVTKKEFQEAIQLEEQLSVSKVDPGDDKADAEVTLADRNGQLYKLGPTKLTGTALESATSGLQGAEWTVSPVFKEGAEGIDAFNALAAQCFSAQGDCPAAGNDDRGQPRGALAIVLDGEVISAPTINASSFQRDQIQISGSFNQESANDLAVALRFGALPLTLQPRQAQTVSATLGEGALNAGLLAGGIGLGLVAIYLLVYYRLLGVVTLLGLGITGVLLYTALSILGSTVTLAGVVGIIVSVGVALDSSVVSFENLKEDVHRGASLRSSVERSFAAAYSTILKADLSSLLGALILVWLSIGSVRGFATMLAVSTVFDLTVAYFFLRPMVILLARKFGDRPGWFGIPKPRAIETGSADPSTPATPATAAEAAGGAK